MQKLGLVSYLSIICLFGLFSNASLSHIPSPMKWALALAYIVYCSMCYDAINKSSRTIPRFIRNLVLFSATLSLLALVNQPNVKYFAFFIVNNTLLFGFWRKYSFQYFASSKEYNDRRRVLVQGELLSPNGVYECHLLEINKNGALIRCDADLEIHHKYNLSFRIEGKTCNIQVEALRRASSTNHAIKFLDLDKREFNDFEELCEYLVENQKSSLQVA